MRGNLVELTRAFVIGASFATCVVKAFTDVFMSLLGKLGGKGTSTWRPGVVPFPGRS
ncbi:MAG: hypothetical protein IPH03_08465 [Tetrasphaera sp.]|nr:hypothetical protein [Tetrasphaera sp.]